MSFQGVEFTSEMRQLVVNVKHFFDQNKQNPQILKECASVLTASALGVSESTVKVIMAAFNKKGVMGCHGAMRAIEGAHRSLLSLGLSLL